MLTIYYILLTVFVVLSFFLMLLVLIQKGRGGGLSAAFGGVGGNTAFGAKTGDVLTWATSIVFGIFIILTIAMNMIGNAYHEQQQAAAALDFNTTQPSQKPAFPELPGVMPNLDMPTTVPATTPATSIEAPATVPSIVIPATQPAAQP